MLIEHHDRSKHNCLQDKIENEIFFSKILKTENDYPISLNDKGVYLYIR